MLNLTYLIWSLNGGGAELALTQIIPAMKNQGCKIRLVAMLEGDGRAKLRFRDAELEFEQVAVISAQLLMRIIPLLLSVYRWRPDVIVTSLPGATLIGQLIGWLLRVPVFSWQHNAALSPRNTCLHKLFGRASTCWIADSAAAARFLTEELGVHSAKVEEWPLYFVEENKTPPARSEQKILIGSTGKLERQKGFDFLIKTAAKLEHEAPELAEKIEFQVVGDGSERWSLEKQVSKLGLNNVSFLGYRNDVGSWLKTLDIYFQPSRWEGLCIAALEAMEADLPVVGSRVGGMADNILDGKNGYLLEPGDIIGYAEAIKALASDETLRREAGQIAQQFVRQKYSYTNFISASARVINRMKMCVAK